MSFLKSFFAAMAANEISEKKRADQERAKDERNRINNSQKILKMQMDFYNYLGQINCKNVSFKEVVSDSDIDNDTVSSYDIMRTEQLFNGYKRQLKEYMSYGGNPIFICDSECDADKMDLYIEIVKRLKEYGWLDKQEQYVKYADDTYFLDFDWKNAQKDRHRIEVQIPAILNAKDNELTSILKSTDYDFVPYESHQNAIVVETVQSNDETVDSFLEFLTLSIVFADKYIIIYNHEHDEIYYKADVTYKIVDVATATVHNNRNLVELNGMSLLFSTDKALEVVNMYNRHNAKISSDIQHQYSVAYENINSLTGVEFERVCKVLLESMGFSVETTKTTGDGGIDLIAYNTQPLLSGKYIIQCKRYTGSVGEPVIRDLYGVVTAERANKGILMTTGHFTKSAVAFATGKPIELIDGVALKDLFSQHGLNVVATPTVATTHISEPFVDVVANKSIIEVAQEMWEQWNGDGYEDDYYELLELKKAADNANNEIKVAEYINWLLEKVDFDDGSIYGDSEKLVFFDEANTYIKKFLKIRSLPKSRLLSYLYQMKFIQNSFLLERFTEAKMMFVEMMKDTGIQFNLFETLGETHNTAEIFENTGVFTFLFATWCNMYQMAFVSNDQNLREYLNDNNLFHGIPILQNSRIEDNLELIRSGKSGLNELYFQKQQKLIQEISEWYTCEPVQTKIFFRIERIDIIKSFYEYAYCDGNTIDDLLDFCNYTLDNGKMQIDYYATIDLDSALQGYVPFNQTDLL